MVYVLWMRRYVHWSCNFRLIPATIFFKKKMSFESPPPIKKSSRIIRVNAINSTLFDRFSKDMKNSVFSPYSIFAVISLLLLGADGQSKLEIQRFLRTKTIPKQQMKTLVNLLHRSGNLKVANGVFASVPLKQQFIDDAKEFYKSLVKGTTFPEPGLKQINDFCKKMTKGMIPKILESLSPLTILVLINCVYFKGEWQTPFEPGKTLIDYTFHSPTGNTKVKMMKRTEVEELFCIRTIGKVTQFKACTLGYKGGEFSMMFIKMITSDYGLFESSVLSQDDFIEDIKRRQRVTKLAKLYIPKFKLKSSFEKEFMALLEQKMPSLFDFKKANLRKMMSKRAKISQAVHKAKMIVDEKGTVAAASTAIALLKEGFARPSPEYKHTFILDRPFYCYLIHDKTNSILFSAKIVNPVN